MPIRCASANRPPPPGSLPPGRADSGVARACRCRATQFLLRRREDNLIKLRPSSLYHTVSRLAESGLIRQEGTERAGNRPERTTYSITEAAIRTWAADNGVPRRYWVAVDFLRDRTAHESEWLRALIEEIRDGSLVWQSVDAADRRLPDPPRDLGRDWGAALTDETLAELRRSSAESSGPGRS
ncbi:hypothetical protein Y013_03505 [Rhodococcus pyridinivorans SB3094]|uniref:Uncharacterized protein n=1 Tax=Rhodococcus pyridinivorans SB3094 TaxID=1435356 RepID=V9XMH4_9NOCA|nr:MULTISPECIES: helix-turn-helix transcriptional regulator [Rhodococcus]AHD23593.1 hypothetical protein Y013_03505 [Rhodococcus pyridinivorans SB3094]MCT7289559.1 helix-turn-helix transcriptional regulator [Rhodococcus sp. PAE-6]